MGKAWKNIRKEFPPDGVECLIAYVAKSGEMMITDGKFGHDTFGRPFTTCGVGMSHIRAWALMPQDKSVLG